MADAEEIIEKKPSAPLASALLIVSSAALIGAIAICGQRLGRFLMPEDKPLIKEGTQHPAQKAYEELGPQRNRVREIEKAYSGEEAAPPG